MQWNNLNAKFTEIKTESRKGGNSRYPSLVLHVFSIV